MNAEVLYRWFMIYQRDIKSDRAKFDLLTQIRVTVELHQDHEQFYFKHCEKYKVPYIMYGYAQSNSDNKTKGEI
jgi:hypothetical protein